ncbi:MAG: efflux RND transporter periplasmic adaptor subunit [Phormidesmis sp.]
MFLTIGIAGWVGYRKYLTPPLEPISVGTTPVEIGSLEITVTESGTVELNEQQTFKSPSDVTVESVQVEERQRVAAGTVLLELRDRGLQRDLNNQQVENQKLDNLLARKLEVLQERQDKLQLAQDRFVDSQSLFDRGFISEDAYRQDQQSVDDALSAIKDAEVELTNAKLDIENNQLTLQNTLTQLSDNQIVAPIDAVVLDISVQPGDGVTQGGELLTIGDPFKETVRLQLTTLNAAKVDVNMPVEVSMIGPDAQIFLGRITRVSPQVNSQDNSSGRGGEQSGTVEAEAILNEPSDGSLIPGSVVSVEVILDQRQSVVVVPLTAIQSEGDRQFVWVKDAENQAQQKTVTVGLKNLQSAEITSGLRVGDEIVPALPPGLELTAGMPLADAPALPADFVAPPGF